MPHQPDSPETQPRPDSSLKEYIHVAVLAALIMVPTWTAVWWLLP
jgi:hypothetical protein